MSDARLPMRIAPLLLLLAGVWAPSCIRYEGDIPAPDQLETPADVVLHPSGRYLYVLNTNFDGLWRVEDGGSVAVIDTDTLEVVSESTVRLGSFGSRLALLGDTPEAPDTLAVTVRGDRSLALLDLADEGRTLFCSRDGSTGTDGRPCRVTGIPRDPFDVVPLARDAERDLDIWGISNLNGRVTLVSVNRSRWEDTRIESIPVLNGATTLLPFPGTDELLVAGRFADRVVSLRWFRAEDGTASPPVVAASASIVESFSASEIRSALTSSDGRRLYLASSGPSSIVVYEMRVNTGGVGRIFYRVRHDLDGAPSAMALVETDDRDTLWVALADQREVVAMDVRTGQIEARVPLDSLPASLVADTVRHQRLYVPLFDDDAIAVIDIDPASVDYGRLVRRIP